VGKADSIYALKIYYVLLVEGLRPKKAFLRTLAESKREPRRAWNKLRGFLSTQKQVLLMDSEIASARAVLDQKTRSFVLQVSDFLPIQILPKQEAFRRLRFLRTLSFLRVADLEHSETEDRRFSVGRANGSIISVVYLWWEPDARTVKIRLISARNATRAEGDSYEAAEAAQ